MTTDGHAPGPEERFEERLRAWASRPPRLDAQHAARAVVTRIERRDRTSWRGAWRLAAAAASLAALVLTGTWRIQPVVAPSPPPRMAAATAPLSSGVVLLWLDEETPLYMTYQAPRAVRETGGTTP